MNICQGIKQKIQKSIIYDTIHPRLTLHPLHNNIKVLKKILTLNVIRLKYLKDKHRVHAITHEISAYLLLGHISIVHNSILVTYMNFYHIKHSQSGSDSLTKIGEVGT